MKYKCKIEGTTFDPPYHPDDDANPYTDFDDVDADGFEEAFEIIEENWEGVTDIECQDEFGEKRTKHPRTEQDILIDIISSRADREW